VTIHQLLITNRFFIATAESLTAGMLGSELASAPGASNYFLGGIISYQDEVKQHLLGVDSNLLAKSSAVSPEVAIQMAAGVRQRFARDCHKPLEHVIGISTTGVAGPDMVGNHAVGEVYLGISSARGQCALALELKGNRSEIRTASVTEALSALEDEIHLLLG
jgi:PncC family amidohydrolase